MRPVPRWLRRALRLARRVVDVFPITPLGAVVAGGAAWLLATYAYGALDLVLLVVGWGAVGLAALTVPFTVGAAAWLRIRLGRASGEAAHPTLEAGVPTPTGRRLPGWAWLPFVDVRWAWESIDDAPGFPSVRVDTRPAAGGGRTELVTVAERCELDGVRRRATVGDVFGLSRVAIRRTDRTPIRVLPHVGRLQRAELLRSLTGGDEQPHPMGIVDGDRVDLRRYVPGDPARFIHWKVFGRTRRLVVRTPERSLSRARRTVAYFAAAAGDEASAAVARIAIQHGAFGDEWSFTADGASADTDVPEEALAMVVRSASARDRGAEGLLRFVARAERRGPATLVVFAPPAPGPWLDRVVDVARRSPRPVRVLIGVDGLSAPPATPRWARLLARPAPATGTDGAALERVVAALRGVRCEVSVFDRPTGRWLGDLARRRAAEGAARRRGGRARTVAA